ncbi:signal recognition particle subunit SRP19/SEC65 family protein [Methanoculleus chikugoensis]|nr:signal recognition particle subunit SRP19/SEC65 family protein [Methanoculleus chikugoensis]
MSAERILYPPCYFDATLERREGRRVAKNFGVKSRNSLPSRRSCGR